MTDIAQSPTNNGTPTLAQGVELYEVGNFTDAYSVFKKLAGSGDATAVFWISVMEMNGDGRPVDKVAGFRNCLRAAELGNVQAQTNLGVMYIQGDGVEMDAETGLMWLCRAADAGDTGAQFNAATLLSAGKSVEPDAARAVAYYRMAAEAGYFPAQARLGFCYRNGLGVAKDRHQAFLWLTLAAQHGAGTAIDMLEGLVEEMSPDELHKGQHLVERWMKDHSFSSVEPRFRVDTN